MLPATIYAGDAISWDDPEVPEDATAVTVWFRTNASGEGVEATGTKVDSKWLISIPAETSAGMTAGTWAYQAVATLDSGPVTYSTGRVQVAASFAFSGTPDAIDLRSQAEKDLEAVEEAIRVLQSGAQSYTIGAGTGMRTFTRPMLSQLVGWRNRLITQVAAERQAAGAGRRDRRILVRFE